jgi:phage shock protein PspC (stress-responsive transcriptional regulator)
MKKVMNASIGGAGFLLDEDAFLRLQAYLQAFRERLAAGSGQVGYQAGEVMDDLEARIAELFRSEVGVSGRVVDLELTNKVIAQLGMPDGGSFTDGAGSAKQEGKGPRPFWEKGELPRKLYRDPYDRMIAGVCSGLAQYFGLDTALIRVIMVVLLVTGTAGFWIYIILWIIAPKAETAAQQCEMHGLPVTAENMARFSSFSREDKKNK